MQINAKKFMLVTIDGLYDFVGENCEEVMHNLCDKFEPVIKAIDALEVDAIKFRLIHSDAAEANPNVYMGEPWVIIMDALSTALECFSKLSNEIFYYPMSISEQFNRLDEYIKSDVPLENKLIASKMEELLKEVEFYQPRDTYDRKTHQSINLTDLNEE